MIEYGDIIINQSDSGKLNYSWDGPPVIVMSFRHLSHIDAVVGKQGITISEDGRSVIVGPYKLKRLKERYDLYGGVYRRVNGSINIRLRSFWIAMGYWFSLINSRILMTLRVWELMNIELGCTTEWKDLKIFKKDRK